MAARRGILAPIIDRIAERTAERLGSAEKSIGRRLTDPVMAQIMGLASGEAKVTEPYKQVSVVYACINAKARNVAQVPFRIYPEGGMEPIERGPLFQLFEEPNPLMSKFQLWESMIVNLDTCGEWHVVKDPEEQAGIPVALWPYPSSGFQPKYREGQWIGWELDKGDGKGPTILLREQVIYDRYYSPYSTIRGLSPLDAVRLSIESDYAASVYNRNFFRNDASPRTIFTTDQNLTQDQVNQLQAKLIDSRKGAENAHRSLMLWGGMDAKPLGLAQKDMEFLEQRKFTREEICMIFKVPKSEISLFEDVNYATALSADRSFWQKTLVPLMVRIEDKLNKDLLRPLGYEGRFDMKSVDALNYAFLEKIDAAAKLWAIGFTANELNERMDLGFPEEPWRDEPAPVSQQQPQPPMDQAPAGKGFPVTSARPSSAEMGEGIRASAWKSVISRVAPIQSKLNRELKNYFFDAEQKILRKLTKGAGVARVKMSSEEIPDTSIDEAFNDEKLKRLVSQYVALSFETGVSTIANTRFDLASDSARAAVDNRLGKIADINDTARSQVKDALKKALKQVIDQGLTEQEAADLIVSTVKDQMDNIGRRARTIARTETHAAYSEGRFVSMDSTNPTAKKWISSRDAMVRDSHRHLDGQQVGWKASFGNGLRFPLDPAGAAEEVINCRCVMVPVYGEGEG